MLNKYATFCKASGQLYKTHGAVFISVLSFQPSHGIKFIFNRSNSVCDVSLREKTIVKKFPKLDVNVLYDNSWYKRVQWD